MAEAVLGIGAAPNLDDEIEALELGERRLELLARHEPLEEREPERPPDHGGDVESTSRVVGSRRSSRACSAPWTSAGIASSSSVDGQLPACRCLHERAALDEVAERLLEEERVAAGRAGEEVGDRLRQLALGRVRGERLARVGGRGRSSTSR